MVDSDVLGLFSLISISFFACLKKSSFIACLKIDLPLLVYR
jgi:hypothetical protein